MGKKNKNKKKTNLPNVSICTPTFNRRPFFEGLISCIESQDYPHNKIEWIIVDDGTDCVRDIVESEDTKKRLKNMKIRYFYESEKMDLGKKRNYMHKKCEFKNDEDIIVYIDDDDYYPPERVSHSVTKLRTNSKKRYDDKGNLAMTGKINQKIFDNAVRNWMYTTGMHTRKSLDVREMESFFDYSSLKKLTLEDGAATFTAFTVEALAGILPGILGSHPTYHRFILCGGGRKNDFLVKSIDRLVGGPELIDDYGIDGDFIESQAFAYLAIRSFLKLPISFPETTGCKKPCTGGILVKNY